MRNRIPLAISAMLLLLLPPPTDISAQDLVVPGQVLIFPPSVRSYGMGMTGVADMSDPANAHFNPALYLTAPGFSLSAQSGEVLPAFESDASFLNVFMSGVHKSFSRGSNDFYLTGHIGYARLDYGDLRELTTEEEPFAYSPVEQSICLTVAGGLTALEQYHVGIGFSVKPFWSSGYEADYFGDLDYRAVAFDVGLILAWDAVEEEGYLIRPSFGFSILNLGIDIKRGGVEHPLPKRGQLGLSLRMETPGFELLNGWTGVDAPVFTLTSSFDIVYDWGDRLQQNYVFGQYFYYWDSYWGEDWYPPSDEFTYMFGVEAAFLQMVFLRWGYFESENAPEDSAMFGFGIGTTYKRLSCRLDWVRIPQLANEYYDETVGLFMSKADDVARYGITLGIQL